ncbi:LysM peptidoglycan-binding domain-containing protein [Peribacillus sp. R9-11]|uniref:LysM peptidoglycan-binding domain-containing protein n=1 Tax=Peribacillus sp. R9-11 TaxID=3073271 RepID=UPI002868DD16|nr:LysM peptidoglycan-binding domain-containing protein [Peribacillus sp. R9-11]WMX56276.1 LysM peptidoglycan-binding domain-containing protein [Peribacillus sp. R9-11]
MDLLIMPWIQQKLKTSVFIENLAKSHVNGDTFYSIAKRYGTTVDNLKSLNPKVDPSSLQIGYKLVVSGLKATYHTVVKGDTVSALAKKYGSTIIQVKDWNKLDSNYTIQNGKKLRVK